MLEDEIIFEEKPLVAAQFTWNKDYLYEACDHCLFPLESAEHNIRRLTEDNEINLPYLQCDITQEIALTQIACPKCQVKYCSESCMMEAEEKYHRTLCLGEEVGNLRHPLNELKEFWKNMHYPPESTTILIIVRMLAMIKQARDKDEMLKEFGDFCDSTVNNDITMCQRLLGEHFANHFNGLHGHLVNVFGDDPDLAKVRF